MISNDYDDRHPRGRLHVRNPDGPAVGKRPNPGQAQGKGIPVEADGVRAAQPRTARAMTIHTAR